MTINHLSDFMRHSESQKLINSFIIPLRDSSINSVIHSF